MLLQAAKNVITIKQFVKVMRKDMASIDERLDRYQLSFDCVLRVDFQLIKDLYIECCNMAGSKLIGSELDNVYSNYVRLVKKYNAIYELACNQAA